MTADLFTYLDDLKKSEKSKIINKVKTIKIKKDETTKLTVFELTKSIKNTIEQKFIKVWVEGEISNYKNHSSGHHYFSIKDDKAVISCVMWRGNAARNKLTLKDGAKVEIQGAITVFPARGNYQLDVSKIKLAGVGDLQLKFEELKVKLKDEGLFDTRYKQSLPKFPLRIGVITAETGAAYQDIKKVIRQRSPFVDITLYNAKVQGENAYKTIVKGIEVFNKYHSNIDVLIVGRGGGSLEDLWPFNEEAVARAFFTSKIPIISAVGHEIDFSISDFVADQRAATPSHAAEIATINIKEQNKLLNQLDLRIKESISKYFKWQTNILDRLEFSYAFQKPTDIIKNYYLTLDNLDDKLTNNHKNYLKTQKNKLLSLSQILNALGPDSILKRGYSIIKDKNNNIIKSASQILSNQKIKLNFHDGEKSGEFTCK